MKNIDRERGSNPDEDRACHKDGVESIAMHIDERQKILTISSEGLHRLAFSRDFYFDDERYQAYLNGTFPAVHLNCASLSAPSPVARIASEGMAAREDQLTGLEKMRILQHAREQAASLVNLSDSTGVIFGRNTTEAGSFAFWLAGLEPGDHVVLTSAEHPSVRRIFEQHMDHGNPYRKDGWSAWATHYSARGPTYPPVVSTPTGINLSTMDVQNVIDEELERELHRTIQGNTKMLVCSHVLRSTGAELPIQNICEIARRVKAQKNADDPTLFILIDGAQALGNVPEINFHQLGCDAYMAAPHKTLRSTVVGLLFIDPKNPSIQQHLPTMSRRCAQVILEGMFDPSLGIEPNVQDYLSLADITGLSAAIDEMHKDGLQGNDFSKSAQKRQALRQYCIEQLHALRSETGVDISIPSAAQPTGSILAVHIPQKDGKSIAKQLSDAGVFISFIAGDQKHPPFNILRISFQFDTTIEEIDICIGTLKGVLRQ